MFPRQVVVLHTLPGLLVGGAGAGLAAWQPTTTSRCVHHVTRGLAVMLLLPATVRDCQGWGICHSIGVKIEEPYYYCSKKVHPKQIRRFVITEKAPTRAFSMITNLRICFGWTFLEQ